MSVEPDWSAKYYLPRGFIPPCTRKIDDQGNTCGAVPAYVVKWKGQEAKSSACPEHAALIRSLHAEYIEYIHSV